MKIIDILNFLWDILGTLIILFTELKVFSILSDRKIKLNLFKIIGLIVIVLIIYVNTYYNYEYNKVIFSFLLILISNILVFKMDFTTTLINSIITYLYGAFLEIIYSFIIISISINSALLFDKNHFIKILFTILISLNEIFLLKIQVVKKNIKKLNYWLLNIQNKNILIAILFIIFFLFINLMFKNGYDGNLINYIINLVILLILILFLTFMIVKIKKEEEFTKKEEGLLSFMSEYEKIIDENRYHNHELVNNLLLIRDYCDKDSKITQELINELIETYDNTKFKKIYNLPSGLKGLFYYKIALIKDATNFIFNCSDKVEKKLIQINDKKYKNLYKALSIILDNAVEAIQNSKEKTLIIDIYFDKKDLTFYIENSFEGKIDESRIYEKNYSSKGKKRGLGLYILRTIVSKASELSLEQKINGNKFITILKIDLLS